MRIFKIPKVPKTTHKSIRFPESLIQEVENLLVDQDCSFTAFVVEAVKVAVENLKEGGEENEEKNETKD